MTTTYSTLYKSLIQASLNKPHLNKSALALAASTLACLPAVAAENDLSVQSDIPVAIFPKMTVTATRTPTAVNNTIAQTRIIDSEDLKRYQGQTVLDVLKSQPSFTFKQDGDIGQSSNFYVRGYDSKRVLVLIDGIRYGSMSTGQPALSLLPADQIDRIEILYGASGSSIYGSDAMGGVIQVFTKGSDAVQSNASVTIGYGSNEHYITGITGQWVDNNDSGVKPTIISVSASRNKTDGISALANQTGANKDDDGYESNNGAISISSGVSNNLTLGAKALYSESTTDYDDYSNVKESYIDQKNGAYSISADYDQDNFNLKFTAGQSIDEVDNNLGDAFETNQTQFTLTGSYSLPLGKAIAGLEWLEQDVDVTPNKATPNYQGFLKSDRDIKSGFLGYQLSTDEYDFQANIRHDNNSQFDTETTYGLGASIDLGNNLRVGTSYATGFRAPSLNDLYVQSNYYIPNPDLDVETSDNTEVFIEFDNGLNNTRLTAYRSDVENLIENQYDNNSGKYLAKNVEDVRLQGISFTTDWNINNYIFGGQYDYTDTEVKSDTNKGNRLAYRPENAGLIYAGYKAANFDVRGELEYVGSRFNSTANKDKLDSYQLLNLSANYILSPNLSMSTRINNLLNEDYSTNETFGEYGSRYNHDGTNFFTSLTYTWK